MSPRKGRHPRRKGPGGPRRSSRVGPVRTPGTAPGTHRDGLLGPSVDNLVRSLLRSVRTVAAPDDPARPLAIEVWADRMAETVYGPEQMPADFYADLAEGLRASDDPDAPAALAALALVLDHRDAAPLRRAQAAERAVRSGADRSDLGIGRATVTSCIEISHPQGDAVSLVLEVDQPGAPHTAAVYVDLNLGGMATDLVLGPPEAGRLAAVDGSGLVVRAVDPAEARARAEWALDLTDHTVEPPVKPGAEEVRGAVERRLALLPVGGEVPEVEPLDPDEIEDLVDAFLASPEAAALGEDQRDEAGWLLDPWLSHATGHAIGDPHRISPTLVELFCLDWYPRKVIGDPSTAEAAPAVLAAWTHYVARITDLDDRWRDEALVAIDRWAPALASSGPDLGLGGGLHDPIDPELGSVIGRDDDPPDHAGDEGADGGSTDDASPLVAAFDRAADGSDWRPLQPQPPGPRRVHWEVDAREVLPEVATKVKAICLQASHAADVLLGPSFVQPAVDLAVRIGTLDPSPLPHTRDDVWSSAVVWLLADDGGALDPHTPGRTRDDLAAALPAARPTITRRATEVRDRLGLAPGDLAVDW